jgi:hypothetical protein
MSELLEDELHTNLLRITRTAEIAMEDPNMLLNTDLEIETYEKMAAKISLLIDSCHKDREEIIKEDETLNDELEQLLKEETNLTSALLDITVYRPQHPKRYKVTLSSL